MSFLYDQTGKRKYLTIDERQAFLDAARAEIKEVYTFCAMLAYTGARISEVLSLTPERIDYGNSLIIIECIKKRQRGVYRIVPVPSNFLELLDDVHWVQQAQRDPARAGKRIWPWCRTSAWQHVKRAMVIAGIAGVKACPKALRHSFAVSALQKGVPINIVCKWLGHSKLETTAIYADAVGDEEREIAAKLWQTF